MIRVYALPVADVREAELERAFLRLEPERRKRVRRYRFEKDRVRCILGETLVRYALKHAFGLSRVSFDIGENGRPFLAEPAERGLDFNISHAGPWVVCALGDSRVGIDVEQIREKDEKLARVVLADQELEAWSSLPDEAKGSEFYRLWTLKESYVKYTGKGLGQAFDTVRTVPEKEGFRTVEGDGSCLLFSRLLDRDCWLSLCSGCEKRKEISGDIVFPSLREVLADS